MYENVELIVRHYKVNTEAILKYDRNFEELSKQKRLWRNCLPKSFFNRLEAQGDCWVWREGAPLTRVGLPFFNCFVRGQKTGASGRQLMWRWCGRPPVESTTVTCGNKRCLRPSHLREGRAERSNKGSTAPRSDAPPPTNKVEFGSGPELGEWLKGPGPASLELGHGLPCSPALFWFRVRVGEGGCWNWFGPYGKRAGPYWAQRCTDGKVRYRVARRSVVDWVGKASEEDPWVKTFTTCGNGMCVNPAHIERGVGRKYAPRRMNHKNFAGRFKARNNARKTQAQIDLEEKGYV